jgi:hypothetical protein
MISSLPRQAITNSKDANTREHFCGLPGPEQHRFDRAQPIKYIVLTWTASGVASVRNGEKRL